MNAATDSAFSLHGQVVAVTGAARGIGLAIAQACAQAGAQVHLIDRLGDELRACAAALGAAGHAVSPHVCELTDPAAVDALFDRIGAQTGRLDGLVNNAGTTVYGGALDTTLADLRRVLDIHLAPTLLCAQAAARLMLATGRGRIVNMSSAAAQAAVTRLFAYSAAKAALIAMTQHMATEWGARGINVNAMAPGPVLTDALRGNQNAAVQGALRAAIPQDRFAEPAEVAQVAVFLLSVAGSYINGQVLPIDGGLLASRVRLDRLG